MTSPRICVLRTDGTNCDEELYYAFEKFGGAPQYIHVNQLRSKDAKLNDFQILALPGGFSYGDDIASGKVLAIELVSFLKDQLESYVSKKGLILGICNGFQVLVRTGLLPFNDLGKMDATLALNDSGHLECRWVKVKIEKSHCIFLNQLISDTVSLDIAVNHGEGKFFTDEKTIQKIENQKLVTFRYVDESNLPTQKYPENPNGSLNAIAGVTDSSGRILGLMPHPEKFVDLTQHPNWRRFEKSRKSDGALIFKNMIDFVKNS